MSARPSSGEAKPPSDLAARLDARYRAPLMAFFLRRAGSRAEAEDLVQEVFMRMIARGETGDVRSADSFVFTIAANLVRDRARSAAAHHQRQHDAIEQAPPDGAMVEHLSPDRVLLGRERLAEALRALSELGPRTRNIFVLYRMENMQRREIAGLYGISVSAVEKHIAKALDHLMQRLGRP